MSLLKSGLSLSCLELVDGRVLLSLAEVYPDMFHWLETSGVANDCSVLLVEAQGYPQVVDQVLGEAEKAVTAYVNAGVPVPEEEAHELWLKLSDVKVALGVSCVEVAIACKQMENLLDWPALGRPMWQARPGAGRAKLYLQDESVVPLLLETLAAFVEEHGQSLVVAYSDQEFSYRVENIPKPQTACNLLKKALKDRYDPKGCLNPLVKL